MYAVFNRVRWPVSQAISRYCSVIIVLSLIFSTLLVLRHPAANYYLHPLTVGNRPENTDYFDKFNRTATHPVDTLIEEARREQEILIRQRSKDVKTAAARYRVRRGRHPPPGFDKWMEYAMKVDAIIVEQFFDRIYHDIAPFWALDPTETATRAASWHHHVQVRNGVAQGVGDVTGRVAWLELWTNLLKDAAPHLPDVDMPINYMDESRILVEWETVDKLVRKERKMRSLPRTEEMTTEYTGLAAVDAAKGDPYEPRWITLDSPRYWDLARAACTPDSPSRNVSALQDYSLPPAFPYDWNSAFSYEGYVQNFTASTDACTQPHLRALHGTFVEPLTMSTTKELIPLFGGCKLTMNNEIVIPGAMYLTDDPFYSGGDSHGPTWEQKREGIVWRGVASGGRHKAENWMHFQRLRLIEMLNGTTVTNLETNGARAMTFELPPVQRYDFQRRRDGTLGKWLSGMSDAGFVDLLCFPRESNCDYLAPYFRKVDSVSMKDQYVNKFIPDVDGNSFSARFRGLLLSTSVPIKSTIYAEWHDYRLMPWLHFVPFDNTFQDLYGILDYFTRDDKGDSAARLIAEGGKTWGEKVLRREDMLLYMWRLLLEFARVCDEKRERLGYVADLAPSSP